MSKELIARLRETLPTGIAFGLGSEAADALEAANRKLEIALEALKKCVDMPKSHEAHRVSVQALAQLGEP